MTERKGFLNCQVWKGWKNGDKLVAAAAHMPKGTVWFAGDGIQLRYLRSQDKCPPRFQGLWDAAMKRQKYMGVLSEADRDEELRRSKFLVDLSLRHNAGQFNRIVQEAMAQGCVVIAVPEFISGTADKPLFVPWKHYLPISPILLSNPKALADRLLGLERDSAHTYQSIQQAARKLVKEQFNRAALGQALIDIAEEGRDTKNRYVKPADLATFVAVFGGKP